MKVGGALLGAYWPPDIPRRVPVPRLPLPALVRKAAAAARSRPAVATAARELSYRELDDLERSVAASLRSLELGTSAVGVCEESAGEALVLLFGALEAGCRVALLDPGEAADVLAARLEHGEVSAILTSTRPGSAAGSRVRLLRLEELARADPGPSPPPRPVPPERPAVLLPARDGLVAHSHFSLAAMATALTSFVPRLRQLDFLSDGPLHEWETLAGALGGLLSGRTVGFASPAAELLDPAEAYTVLRRRAADAVLASGNPQGWEQLRYVFVSVGPFAPRWRRRLEEVLGKAVLPVWGSAEVGPVIAAHPTWFPLHAHGVPIVNVTLVPVDPGSGRQSEVPWAMLARAELGVEAPSTRVAVAGAEAAAGLATPAPHAEAAGAIVVRTSAIVEVDTVGIVRFLA